MPYSRAVSLTLALTAALGGGICASARAQTASGASIFLVQGIPGRDLGPAIDPSLPVDISVNGTCLLRNVAFGTISGPFALTANIYEIKVSPAVEPQTAGCSQSPMIDQKVTLTDGETAGVVAALTTSGSPTLDVITLDLASVARDRARIALVNTASAQPIDLAIDRGDEGGATSEINNVKLGGVGSANVGVGEIFASLQAQGSKQFVAGPVQLNLHSHDLVLMFATGSASKGSVTLLSRIVPNVL